MLPIAKSEISKKDIRDSFFDELHQIGSKDHDVVIITNDMDVFSLREFKNNFPNQFINIGVAEQNMINVAAGLASFLSPCVFSLVPVYIGYLNGQLMPESNGIHSSSLARRRGLPHGIAFVLGFSLKPIFTILLLFFAIFSNCLGLVASIIVMLSPTREKYFVIMV